MAAAGELNEQADALIGYFVDQARSTGASWSQIGSAMGVSKQAAQKRFVARDDEPGSDIQRFSRFVPRARAALAGAGRAAGDGEVDLPGLVAGLLADEDALATRVVRRLGVAPEDVYGALGVEPARGGDPDPTALRRLRFDPAVRDALREGLRSALRLGHNYIGTEHLLVGVVTGDGVVAEALAGIGLTNSLVEGALSVVLAEVQLERRREPR
jgi:ATP-dependent Clp protease ATP-binding subunit ClpA